ncbi:hypothetical protein [Hymenobacter negativus]|uniref:Glycosyltransferase RgtA/B/C/D-like domain-containing protein n=1 Tax=Hymenobacter negativus TaxID=2795026 RepID=A0ABS3QAM4_9BACT|nr:hypothetical protein [Hymenobacter negativus]MBO2008314.1 hypothetical protein [Hymenobacter negativus]
MRENILYKSLLNSSWVRQHLLWLGVGLLVSIGMTHYYEWLLLEMAANSDVSEHVGYIVKVCNEGCVWPANPGFYWLTWVVSGVQCTKDELMNTATIVLGACWGVSAYLACWVGSHIRIQVVSQTQFVRFWPALGGVLAAVAGCFLYPAPVNMIIESSYNYLGLLPPNVYHNSTWLAALPFSVAAFGLGIRQLRAGGRGSFVFDALLGLVLVCGALCKPSYAFAFVPTYGLLWLLNIRRPAIGRLLLGFALAILPVLLLIVGQAKWIALHPEVSVDDKSHFVFGFPAGWKIFMPQLSSLESFKLGITSFALPLVVYALRPQLLRQLTHQCALISTVVAFAQFMLVYESGIRASHGNFTWQVIATNHLLYWLVTLDVLCWRPNTKADWAKQIVLLTAIVLSVISGLHYMDNIGIIGHYI